MNYLSNYDIAFKGLKETTHQFNFEIDDKFFEKFENSEVEKGLLKAVVNFTKQSTLLILEITVKGTVVLQCDRCLDDYNQKIKNKSKLYIKFGATSEEMDDEIMVIPIEENKINVAQLLYELVILGLPIQHVHPDDKKGNSTCDPLMIEKLKEYIVDEDDSDNKDEPVDERWSELKKLLENK